MKLIPLGTPKSTCTPKDMIELSANIYNYTADDIIKMENNFELKCKDLCNHLYTKHTISTEALDVEELVSQMRGTEKDHQDGR